MDKEQELLEAIDESNEVGFIDLITKPTGAAGDGNWLAVCLGDGVTVFAPTYLFSKAGQGKFRFAGNFDTLRRERLTQSPGEVVGTAPAPNQESSAELGVQTSEQGEIVVPLIAEELHVTRKTVQTGGVRIHKTVREDVQVIDEPIIREHLDVERVAINQFVETAPVIRYEGDVMIIPVLEEVVVTQKRLLLREELRLVKRREEISAPEQFTLRREEINLERIEIEDIEPGTPDR